MTAELLFEGRRPRHELEAKAVVDHGEAAGGERDALAIGAGDIFAVVRAVEGLASLGSELLAERVHFSAAQRIDQVAAKNDSLTVPFAEALFDQMGGAGAHGVAHLGAEAAFR